MKTRACFVSNSSTTSFMILGYRLCSGDDNCKKISLIPGMEVYNRDSYSSIYIGKEIEDMEPNETKAQWMHRVKIELDSKLKDAGINFGKGFGSEFGFHTDGWYDG